MKRVEQAVRFSQKDIENKKILEIACGSAEFSAGAASIASKVCCIDLDSSRLEINLNDFDNLEFEIMDATRMKYENQAFDTVVIYNAIAHLEEIIDEVLTECVRVVKKGGSIYVISSFKMDKFVIREKLLPRISNGEYKVTVTEDKTFTYVTIKKGRTYKIWTEHKKLS